MSIYSSFQSLFEEKKKKKKKREDKRGEGEEGRGEREARGAREGEDTIVSRGRSSVPTQYNVGVAVFGDVISSVTCLQDDVLVFVV